MTLTLFAMLPAVFAFDHQHAALDGLLTSQVSGAGVDYVGLRAQATTLDAYLAELEQADLSGATKAQQEAFWINAYNALTLDLVVDEWPVASIRDLDGGKVWDRRTWIVAGRTVTLNDIEHEILRPLGDPRIHAAINCASKGCPPLRAGAFTATGLDGQLDQAASAWARGNAVVIGADRVGLNRIFDWFGEDFVAGYGAGHHDIPGVDGKQEAALNFVAAHLPEDTRTRLQAGGYTVYYTTYDWTVNGP